MVQGVPRRFLCCSSSLFVGRWVHIYILLKSIWDHYRPNSNPVDSIRSSANLSRMLPGYLENTSAAGIVGTKTAGFFSCFVLCVVLLCLVDHVKHCDHLDEEGGAGCLVFLWFVACVMSVMVSVFFLLLSLVGYVL